MASPSYIQLDFFESENNSIVKLEMNELRSEMGRVRRGVFQRMAEQKKQINSLVEEIHYLKTEIDFLRYNLQISKDENLA